MADDDWRLTFTLDDASHARRAIRLLREHDVGDQLRRRLGHRVAVSTDGSHVFLYAGTEDAAREADQVIHEVLTRHQLSADLAIERWHPLEQEWKAAGDATPDDAELRRAEHQRLMDEETRQSQAHGQAGWEVRAEMPSRHEAVELAERLRAQGHPVIRRWKYLILGADNEDEASSLAQTIEHEAPGVPVRTGMAQFAHYGPAEAGEVLFPTI